MSQINRKSFFGRIAALCAAPFVAQDVVADLMKEKQVKKQTAVEQKNVERFYTKPNTSYAVSGICMTGTYMPMICVSGVVSLSHHEQPMPKDT